MPLRHSKYSRNKTMTTRAYRTECDRRDAFRARLRRHLAERLSTLDKRRAENARILNATHK